MAKTAKKLTARAVAQALVKSKPYKVIRTSIESEHATLNAAEEYVLKKMKLKRDDVVLVVLTKEK